MAISIHTNYAALLTQTNMAKSNAALGVSQQRLGTGYRVNSAADDAAGLQIATRLNAQARGQAVAQRNAQDGISMLQTAEGALNEFTNVVLRMKDLAIQAANGTNSADDLKALDAEYGQLKAELQNIMDNTNYGADNNLFASGSGKLTTALTLQIGSSAAETLDVEVHTQISKIDLSTIAADLTASGAANGEISKLDTLLTQVGEARG